MRRKKKVRRPRPRGRIRAAAREKGEALKAKMKSPVPHGLASIIGFTLFFVSFFVLMHEIKKYNFQEVARHLNQLHWTRYAIALVLTLLGYFMMTLYDLLGIVYINRPMKYRRIALASFIGYAISNNVGSAMVSGGSVRYRLYTGWGLTMLEVTQVVIFGIKTYWVGFFALVGPILVLQPRAFTSIVSELVDLPVGLVRWTGIAFIVLIALYLFLSVYRRRPLKIWKWDFPIPTLKLCSAQIAISALDLVATGAVLYTLLPDAEGISFVRFIGAFALAMTAGLVSHIPGGIGVFETMMVASLSDFYPTSTILGSLLAYRGFYYLMPLAGAALLLGGYEIRQKLRGEPGLRKPKAPRPGGPAPPKAAPSQ